MKNDLQITASYIELGWENNIRNCNIPTERSHMISDNDHGAPWITLRLGHVLEQMDLKMTIDYTVNRCGKWIWIEFRKQKHLSWFLLLWEGPNGQ